MKYTRKTEIVDAIMVTEDTFKFPIPEPDHLSKVVYDTLFQTATVMTPEGGGVAFVGDWIVRAPNGDMRVYKAKEFKDTYEPCEIKGE